MKQTKFNFTGNTEGLINGIEILSKKIGFEICDDGFPVNIIKTDNDFGVSVTKKNSTITFSEKHQFFRGLSFVLEYSNEEFQLKGKQCFDTVGAMFDCSRNAVLKVSAFKDIVTDMALMGYNMVMLYTEDTYEVEKYPYFGYMRGRYTYEELKECDDFADNFGIEVIPCIQTLAHLKRTLKWNHGGDIKDTADVLLVGSEDTYKFIRTLMETATKPFRSKRIHLGLDEAHGIGLGTYLRRNGYTPASELVRIHCTKVMDIAKEMGLEPMIWADMFFRIKSASGNYYEDLTGEFTDEDRKSVPKNSGLVYWDYYKETNEEYRELIRLHKQLSDDIIFAGSVWSWNRFAASNRKTLATMVPAVEECTKAGIKEAFITMWGDDGCEANIISNLYGIQLFAELCYGNSADYAYVDKRFNACTGEIGVNFRKLDLLDEFGNNQKASNASKSMLWQDPLIGLFDKHIDVENIGELYKERKEVFLKAKNSSLSAKELFEFAYRICDVLETKSDLGIRLKKYYDAHDRKELKNLCCDVIPSLIEKVNKLHVAWRELWLSTNKIFGFEEIEHRLGALIIRLESTCFRLNDFLEERISKIEELEEKRLPINPNTEGLNFTELSYRRLSVSND